MIRGFTPSASDRLRPILYISVRQLPGGRPVDAAVSVASRRDRCPQPLVPTGLTTPEVALMTVSLPQLYVDYAIDLGVDVAAIILLQPGVAMIAVGTGTLLAQVIRRQDPAQSAFNAAQTMLQAAVGGVIVTGADGRISAHSPGDPLVLALVLVASAAIFLITNVYSFSAIPVSFR